MENRTHEGHKRLESLKKKLVAQQKEGDVVVDSVRYSRKDHISKKNIENPVRNLVGAFSSVFFDTLNFVCGFKDECFLLTAKIFKIFLLFFFLSLQWFLWQQYSNVESKSYVLFFRFQGNLSFRESEKFLKRSSVPPVRKSFVFDFRTGKSDMFSFERKSWLFSMSPHF